MRRIIILVSVTALLLIGAVALAKPPTPAPLSIPPPVVDCGAPGVIDPITVTVSVSTAMDLDSLSFTVERWGDVTGTSFPDGYDYMWRVETWWANFPTNGASVVPTTHTLDTANDNTWEGHEWVDPVNVAESWELYTIYVIAETQGKRKGDRNSTWADWVIDCSAVSPVVESFTTWPWDIDVLHEDGRLRAGA